MKMDHRRWALVFTVLAVLVTLVIWGNSLRTVQQCDALNLSITDAIRPSLDPDEKVEKEVFQILLSKCVHVIEFTALGFCLGGAVYHWGAEKGRKYVALPMLLALSVGVLDEFIQTFTGRSSAISDVLLDFGSAMLGFCLVSLVLWIWHRKKTSG